MVLKMVHTVQDDTLTRGQMAKIISNAFKLSSNGANFHLQM